MGLRASLSGPRKSCNHLGSNLDYPAGNELLYKIHYPSSGTKSELKYSYEVQPGFDIRDHKPAGSSCYALHYYRAFGHHSYCSHLVWARILGVGYCMNCLSQHRSVVVTRANYAYSFKSCTNMKKYKLKTWYLSHECIQNLINVH